MTQQIHIIHAHAVEAVILMGIIAIIVVKTTDRMIVNDIF